MSYIGPAVLATPHQEIDIEIKLTLRGEPVPGGARRAWTAEFTTTDSPVPLMGECTIRLPDGHIGNAHITGWRADQGNRYTGLLSGAGPLVSE